MKAIPIITAIVFLTAFLPVCWAADSAPPENGADLLKEIQYAGSVEVQRRLADHAPIDGVYGPLISGSEFDNGFMSPLIFDMFPDPKLQELRKEGGWLDGWDALMWASYTDNIDMVQRLIAAGANMNAQDWNGNTSLMMAARGGHLAVVKLLIHSGARQDTRNWNGYSVLHCAVKSGSISEVSELIVNDHMDPNRANPAGQTPYMVACDDTDIPMINFLLDHGANSTQRDDYGQTGAEVIAEYQRVQQIYKRLQPIFNGTK